MRPTTLDLGGHILGAALVPLLLACGSGAPGGAPARSTSIAARPRPTPAAASAAAGPSAVATPPPAAAAVPIVAAPLPPVAASSSDELDVTLEVPWICANPALAVDAQGRVAALLATVDGLRVARWDGRTLHLEVVDPSRPGCLQGVVGALSAAFDHGGRLHVVYPAADGLRYATWTRAGWRTEMAAADVRVESAAIASSVEGEPEIVFGEGAIDVPPLGAQTPCRVRHARRIDGRWAIQTVDEGPAMGYSVAIGANEHGAHIAYVGWADVGSGRFAGRLVHAQRTQDGFRRTTLVEQRPLEGALLRPRVELDGSSATVCAPDWDRVLLCSTVAAERATAVARLPLRGHSLDDFIPDRSPLLVSRADGARQLLVLTPRGPRADRDLGSVEALWSARVARDGRGRLDLLVPGERRIRLLRLADARSR